MASPLGTLAVRITADIEQFRNQLGVSQKQLKDLQKVASTTAKGAGIAFAALTAELVLATRAASESIRVEKQLAESFRAAGNAVNVEAFSAYASSLQRVTTFEDDAIMSAAGLLASFGLTQTTVAEMLPTVLNLSSAYGMDLTAATQLAGKAMSGNLVALQKMGVQLTDAQKKTLELGGESERAAVLIDLLAARTGNAAEIAASTASGSFAQLKNALGDVHEEIGKAIDKPLAGIFTGLRQAIEAVPKPLQQLGGAFAILGTGLAGFVANYGVMIAFGPQIASSIKMVGLAIKTSLIPALMTAAPYMVAIAAGALAIASTVGAIKRISSGAERVGGFGAEAAENIKVGFDTMLGPLKTAMSSLVPTTTTVNDALKEYKQKIGEVGDADKKTAKARSEAAKSEKEVQDLMSESWAKMLAQEFEADRQAMPGLSASALAAQRGGAHQQVASGAFAPSGGVMSTSTTQAASSAEATSITLKQRLANAGQLFGDTIVRALGEAGGVVNSALQGFQTAGPWGAVAAVAADLVSRSDSFAESSADLEQTLGELVEAFEPLAEAMQPMTAVTNELFRIIGKVLKPVFEFLGPVFEWLAKALRNVALAILIIIKGIGSVWNGIVGAVSSLLRKIADLSIFGKHPFGKLDDWADTVDRAKVRMEDLNNTIHDLETATTPQIEQEEDQVDTNNDTAGSIADLGTASTEAARSMNETLNAPSGFKVELRRFRAAIAEPRAGQTIAASSGVRDAGGVGGATVNVATVQVVANDPSELARQLQDLSRYASYRMTGNVTAAYIRTARVAAR